MVSVYDDIVSQLPDYQSLMLPILRIASSLVCLS